jgi:hypothetical protein
LEDVRTDPATMRVVTQPIFQRIHQGALCFNGLDDFRHRIVIPVVVGSSPISHPKNLVVKTKGYALQACNPFVFLEDEFQILEDG